MTAFPYFAFISYSRKDKKFAAWLQRRIETYRLPTKIIKSHSELGLPKKLSPVFRDKTDLNEPYVWEGIQRGLESSQYLIVICSPNSVKSEYVPREIEYFKSLGRQGNIIPLILDGTPFSDDPEAECFPEPIKTSFSKEKGDLLGISVKEYGRYVASLRVIARMLGLAPDNLEQREKKRTLIRRITAGAAGLVLAAAAAVTIWYNIPHSKYYNAYKTVNEIPVGICELSPEQRMTAYDCYRITTQRGRVIRLETVNSKGNSFLSYFTETIKETYPVTEYTDHDNSGRPQTIIHYNDDGKTAVIKKLIYDDNKNICTIDLYNPQSPTTVTPVSIGYNDDDISSEITRLINTYDENGYVETSLYAKSNLNVSVCDKNGVYGVKYTYTDNGLIESASNLGKRGDVQNSTLGWAVKRFEYDNTTGTETASKRYNADNTPALCDEGYHYISATVDEVGNLLTQRCFLDENGEKPVMSSYGFHYCNFEYENGKLKYIRYYDDDDKPVNIAEGFHMEEYEYGSYGKQRIHKYYDTDGNLVQPAGKSYTYHIREHDKKGRVIKESYFDTDGNSTTASEYGASSRSFEYNDSNEISVIRYSGKEYASRHSEYDDDGNLYRISYRDTDGKLAMCNEEYAVFECDFDIFGNITEGRFYDTDEKLTVTKRGYAVLKHTYESGRIVYEERLDENRNPSQLNGYYATEQGFDDFGAPTFQAFYGTDADGKTIPTVNEGLGIHKVEWVYIDGMLTEQRFYGLDQDGKVIPIVNESLGYHRSTQGFDEFRNMNSIAYFDADGAIINEKTGFHRISLKYDKNNNVLYQAYYGVSDTDKDTPIINSLKGYHKVAWEYDENGNCTSEAFFGLSDNGEIIPIMYSNNGYHRIRWEFDENGNLVSIAYFGENDKSIIHKAEGYHRIRREYDGNGKLVSIAYFGNNDAPIIHQAEGYHRIRREYDGNGKLVSTAYFGENDKSIIHQAEGYHRVRYEFDENGNLVSVAYFGENDESIIHKTNGYHRIRREYDENGKLVSIAYYGENDVPIIHQEKGWHRAELFFNEKGERTLIKYLDENNNPIE